MRRFIFDEYGALTNESTISRMLKERRISRKKLERQASQRNPELREHWLVELAGYNAEQLIFIDESAAN